LAEMYCVTAAYNVILLQLKIRQQWFRSILQRYRQQSKVG